MGNKAKIFLLDMGEPIKIVDMAEDLIRLSGLVPGKDIEVKITQPRPGEKLYEDLVHSDDILEPTTHPKISVVKSGRELDYSGLEKLRTQLSYFCDLGAEAEVQNLLMDIAHDRVKPESYNQAAVVS